MLTAFWLLSVLDMMTTADDLFLAFIIVLLLRSIAMQHYWSLLGDWLDWLMQ